MTVGKFHLIVGKVGPSENYDDLKIKALISGTDVSLKNGRRKTKKTAFSVLAAEVLAAILGQAALHRRTYVLPTFGDCVRQRQHVHVQPRAADHRG